MATFLTTQRMAYLSAALQGVLDATGWTQRHLAELCNVPPPQMNRYLRGVNRVPIESMEKLLKALPEEFQPSVLAAYLRDSIPAGFEHLVLVSPIGEPMKEDAPLRLPEGMDEDLKSMVTLFADLGIRHREVRDMMQSFLRLVAPDRAP